MWYHHRCMYFCSALHLENDDTRHGSEDDDKVSFWAERVIYNLKGARGEEKMLKARTFHPIYPSYSVTEEERKRMSGGERKQEKARPSKWVSGFSFYITFSSVPSASLSLTFTTHLFTYALHILLCKAAQEKLREWKSGRELTLLTQLSYSHLLIQRVLQEVKSTA